MSYQPPAPAPVDPDDAAADLDAAFQEVTNPPEVLVIQDPPPPVGRSWAFNFAAKQFVRGGGDDALSTNDIATLLGWIEKCLHTARGAHPIHPPGYGMVRPFELIGQTLAGAPVAEVEERVRDALTFHPRISDIQDFDWDVDEANEAILITFTVLLDDNTQVPVTTTLDATAV